MTIFAMVSESRSGSSVIDEELNQHPEIVSLSEVARPNPEERGLANDLAAPLHLGKPAGHLITGQEMAAWTGELNVLFPAAKAIGFKLLTSYLDHLEGGLTSAAEGVDVFIWLRRHNYLRRALSGLVVRETGVFNSREGPKADRRMHIPVRRLLRRMNASKATAEQLRLEFNRRNRPYLEVSYEDFLEDRVAFYRPILSFLGVAPTTPTPSNLKIMVPERLQDLAENYEEVANAVTEAGFGEWLAVS